METQEIERDIISMIINRPQNCETCGQTLRPDDFRDTRHRRIFETTMSLCSQYDTASFDFFLLLEHMTDNGVLAECGGLAYLVELADRTASRTADDLQALIENILMRNTQKSILADS